VIVVDTSAIMAVLLREETAGRVRGILANAAARLISAGTMTELLVVATGRKYLPALRILLASMPMDVVPVDLALAEAAGAGFGRWGKGQHTAALNFGDCFAYALARSRDLPLLYVGQDFAQTDVRSALVP
jgi:ribonuclease VapC